MFYDLEFNLNKVPLYFSCKNYLLVTAKSDKDRLPGSGYGSAVRYKARSALKSIRIHNSDKIAEINTRMGKFVSLPSVGLGLENLDPEFFHLWILIQLLCILKREESQIIA
jgi:hypothetical protein